MIQVADDVVMDSRFHFVNSDNSLILYFLT